jgi:PAS domain S-box-containing protein
MTGSAHASGHQVDKVLVVHDDTATRLLFQSNPHPMWIFDLETRAFLDVNDAAIEGYGYSREEFLAMTLADIRPPEDLSRLLDNLSRVTEGLDRAGIWRHCRKDGTQIYVEITSHTIIFDGRRAEMVLAYDMTERLRAEDALNQSEERYRDIIEGVYDIVYVVAKDESFLELNQAFEKVSWWSRQEWIGKSFRALIHPEDLPVAWGAFQAGLQGKSAPSFELRVFARAGQILTIEANLMPQFQDGRVVALLGIARDISERKRNEKELERVNRALRTVSECNRALIYERDEQSMLMEICRSVVRNSGYRFAWVGYAVDDDAKNVMPVASAGHDGGYLETIAVTWDDTETGRGVVGTAIRTGQRCVIRDLATDENFAPWREAARTRGYCSAIGLPLEGNGKVHAALAIYSLEPDAFGESEVTLLAELAANLSHGIMALRMREEHRKGEEALKKSQTQLKEALRLARLGSWSWDAGTDAMTWSDELCHVTGLHQSLAPRTLRDHAGLLTPQSRMLFEKSAQLALETGKEFRLELELLAATGRPAWLSTRGAAIRGWEGGRIVGLHGTCQDISERKSAEEKQNQLQSHLAAMGKIASMVDDDYKALNDTVLLEALALTGSIYGFFGYLNEDESRLTVHSWTNSVMRDCQMRDKPLVFTVAEYGVCAQVLHTRKALIVNDYQGENPGNKGIPGGHVTLTRLLLVPIFNQERVVALALLANKERDYTWGDYERVNGFLQNVQIVLEKRKVEESLVKLSQAVEQSPVSILITDSQGNIEFVNPKFTQLTGFQPEEVLGQNPRLMKSGETSALEYRRLWETIASGGTWHGEFLNKKKNGELFREMAAISPVRNRDGVITHYVAIKEDITERRQLEEQLRHSQKLEAIGTLSGGIAHDFNNILTTVIGNCAMLDIKLPKGDPLGKYVAKILAAAERAASLTRGLLAYSRKQPDDVRSVDLNKLISHYQDLLSRLLTEDIELCVRTTGTPLTVLAGHVQIEQLLMNLATNARDAMTTGGTLEISTAAVEMDQEIARNLGNSQPGKYAVITVSDSGDGMDQKTRERIFEPFFTTKEVGKGTGLGLSITYGIIKQYGGHIDVASKPGHGTTFTIYLPRTEQCEPSAPHAPQPRADVGTETILVVEDDASIRALFREVLQAGGYRVITAVDGQDAISRFHEHGDDIQLLVLDMIMPKKNGLLVYEEIKRERPDIRALFISGYGADILTARGLSENKDVHLVTKPVAPELLLAKIREVLERKPYLGA